MWQVPLLLIYFSHGYTSFAFKLFHSLVTLTAARTPLPPPPPPPPPPRKFTDWLSASCFFKSKRSGSRAAHEKCHMTTEEPVPPAHGRYHLTMGFGQGDQAASLSPICARHRTINSSAVIFMYKCIHLWKTVSAKCASSRAGKKCFTCRLTLSCPSNNMSSKEG